jgi:8-oxo-dGTP pyrophosphatase MutT (NUDIX family)
MPDPEDARADVHQLGSRIVYENPWMVLTEDTVLRRDGSTGLYGVVHSRDFVVVIPFDGTRYHLVEQYRYPIGARRWEFPQGSAGDAETTTPEQMAVLELSEESGLSAARLQHLGYLHHDYGRSTNGFHAFLAEDLTPVGHRREPEEQDMRSGEFTLEEIWQLVETGSFTDAASLAALALLERHRATDSAGRRTGASPT